MRDMDLSAYKVTLLRVPLFNTWTWRAVAPNGETLSPLGIGFVAKDAAERNAAQRIASHAERETLSGEELCRRVEGQARDHAPATRTA
jgi:hypothetical protein